MGCGKDRAPAVLSSLGSDGCPLAPFPLPKAWISFRDKILTAVHVTVFRVTSTHDMSVFNGLLQHLKSDPKPSWSLPLQKEFY